MAVPLCPLCPLCRPRRGATSTRNPESPKLQMPASKFLTAFCLLTAVATGATDLQITGSARTALAIVEDPRSHRPTVDLGADDFVIQEGPEPREVLSVRVADYPAIVMLDTS